MTTVNSMANSGFEPGTIGWTRALVAQLAGSGVESISAPGGPGRQSVRAHLADGRTVIATRRENAASGETEAAILQILSEEAAPVPSVLGFRDGLLVQQDLGRNRLSHAMVHADPKERLRLARAAFTSLQACREVMGTRPDVMEKLPGLGTRKDWAENFISQPFFLSGDLGVPVPAVETEALAASLSHAPEVFTCWNARLAKAAVGEGGRVFWYGWDTFGRRAGVEDLGGLVADNYWQLSLDQTLDLLGAFIPEDALRQLAVRMAVLVGANRLQQIARRLGQDGWSDAEETLRLGRMAAVPDVVVDLTTRLADLARSDPLTEGFGPWFADVRDAMLRQTPPTS